MVLNIGQLVTAHVVLTTVLAGMNLYSSLTWRRKAMLVLLTSISFFVVYFSYAPLLGWPSNGQLPERFNLVAAYGQEPDEVTGRRGSIFFWVTDKRTGDITPRSFVVDFEPHLHARVKQAMQRKHKSIPQGGTVDPDLTRMGVAKEQRKGYKTQKFKINFADELPETAPTKTDLPADSDEGSPEMAMPSPAGDENARTE
ncbi:MAG: hypothetical protein ACRESK_00260 [Gammaproteobacteria bacterium]